MRFRQSTLKTWMACALQARFAHIDKLPQKQNAKASFGTCIHHALAMFNETGDEEAAVEDFQHYWHNPEKLGVEPEVWPKFTTYGGLREQGIQIIRDYVEKLQWEQRTVVAVEHPFLVPFGDHELSGTVDLVEMRKNHKGQDVLRVVDYKTNTRQPTKGELAVNIQFTVYTYATLQREFWTGVEGDPDHPPLFNGDFMFGAFSEVARRGIWYHLWTGKEIDAGTRADSDFMRMYRLCQEIARAVELEVYVPTISGDSCTVCDYANGPCPVQIPERAERAAEDAAWV